MGGLGSFVPWEGILGNVFAGLLTDLAVVVAGVLFARTIQTWCLNRRYGGWKVRLLDSGGKEILERTISPRKAREILSEPSDLSVFLKGVVSPYAHLKCDVIEEGRELGLLVEDREKKVFVIDLANNPPPRSKSDVRRDVL